MSDQFRPIRARVIFTKPRPLYPAYRPDVWLDEVINDAGHRVYHGIHFPTRRHQLDAGEETETDIVVRHPEFMRPLRAGESIGIYEGHTLVGTMTVLEDWCP